MNLCKEFCSYFELNLVFQGYGTNFYKDNEYFEGEWHKDKRSGWGRMYYEDGAVYEGEWLNDMRHGNGMLRLGKLFTHSRWVRKNCI